jgi:hypothetical protein
MHTTRRFACFAFFLITAIASASQAFSDPVQGDITSDLIGNFSDVAGWIIQSVIFYISATFIAIFVIVYLLSVFTSEFVEITRVIAGLAVGATIFLVRIPLTEAPCRLVLAVTMYFIVWYAIKALKDDILFGHPAGDDVLAMPFVASAAASVISGVAILAANTTPVSGGCALFVVPTGIPVGFIVYVILRIISLFLSELAFSLAYLIFSRIFSRDL